jgi:DNA topoisomerase-2
MIVDKELVVSNRRKADIVAELRRRNFRPFSRVSKTKGANEDEGDEEERAEIGADNDYDYLLGMAIGSLTKEKV